MQEKRGWQEGKNSVLLDKSNDINKYQRSNKTKGKN